MAKKKHEGALGALVDKVLHPGHEESDMEREEREDQEAMDAVEPAKKSSVGAGAASEGKHHQKKFDKFKKGNR